MNRVGRRYNRNAVRRALRLADTWNAGKMNSDVKPRYLLETTKPDFINGLLKHAP